MTSTRVPRRRGGFTLVELAIVLVVLGVLARALLTPFGERLERRRHDETSRRLAEVRRALVGHLVTRGVLPCPLSPGRLADGPEGIEPDVADGADARRAPPCRRGHGHVPAVALGVGGAIDPHGALLDGWGRPLRYGVSLASDDRRGDRTSPDWLVPGEIETVGARGLAADLSLCRRSATGACPHRLTRADALAFVVVSTGADASAAGIGGENVDGDAVYAFAPPSIASDGHFDDLLVWGSRDELAYWLLRAGWWS